MTSSITVGPRGVGRLRAGHPWVRREDVVDGQRPPTGDVVRLEGARGQLLGTGLWSPTAPIAARLVDRGEVDLDERLLAERISAAWQRRKRMLPGADAMRVAHAEADRLPGLFIDLYGDVAVVQTACAAMDAREESIARAARSVLGVRLVVARDDGSVRDLEGLPRRKGRLAGEGPTVVRFHDAGSLCEIDVLEDAKTGGFLDQQESHARVAELVEPGVRALDAFTYHGGFALAMARSGARVRAIDESAAAVARARANARLNGVEVDVAQANAFDELRRLEAEGERFGVVVIDPPALAKRRSALPAAERAYKELFLRGLRLLSPGGIIACCSCSGRLTVERFAAVVEDAARDAGRAVQLLERRGAGRDHPPLLGVPETEYLKCWILRAID